MQAFSFDFVGRIKILFSSQNLLNTPKNSRPLSNYIHFGLHLESLRIFLKASKQVLASLFLIAKA
jgi:hypothetical protein